MWPQSRSCRYGAAAAWSGCAVAARKPPLSAKWNVPLSVHHSRRAQSQLTTTTTTHRWFHQSNTKRFFWRSTAPWGNGVGRSLPASSKVLLTAACCCIGGGAALCMAATTSPTSLLHATADLASVSFPSYRTRWDVDYWLKYYYKHAEPELVALAVQALSKENALVEPKEQWMVTGFLSALFARALKDGSLSSHTIKELEKVMREKERTVLYLSLWMAGAKEHLLQLCKEEEQAQQQRDKKTTEEEEQERKAKEKEHAQRTAVIQQLLEEVPLDVMKAPITVQNVEMNVHILSGMFFATGEASPLLKMVSELEHYSGEKLQNVSNGEGEEEDDEHQRRRKQMIVLQNQNEFVVGKSVRDHLLILCHEHERVMQVLKEVCNRFEEESKVLSNDINAPMMIRMKEGEGELMVNAVIHENLRKIIGLVERVKEEQERLWRETEQRAQRQMEERAKREEEAARVRMR
ncbi:hypothetical protein QOT17_023483 [Balamuthia mandrillaris]